MLVKLFYKKNRTTSTSQDQVSTIPSPNQNQQQQQTRKWLIASKKFIDFVETHQVDPDNLLLGFSVSKTLKEKFDNFLLEKKENKVNISSISLSKEEIISKILSWQHLDDPLLLKNCLFLPSSLFSPSLSSLFLSLLLLHFHSPSSLLPSFLSFHQPPTPLSRSSISSSSFHFYFSFILFKREI